MSRPRRPAPSSGRRPPSERRRGVSLKHIALGLLLVLFMGTAGLLTGFAIMLARLPSVEELLAARPLGATTIYDREGRLVASLQEGQNRHLVPLSEIADVAQKAVVASEDIRFFEHFGLDPRGLARALFNRGSAGGGSTLTQQLAKNIFLTSEYTLTRKLADMWLAVQLERTISKHQILEMYLNQVYWGHGAYGIEAASRKYFGKKARALNIAESAMLAGLLPAPEYFSPYRHPEEAKKAQGRVLGRMVDAGVIDAATAEKEAARRLTFAGTPDYAYRAPYFVSHVLSVLSERLGADYVMRGGLKIYTTVDMRMQEHAEKLIKSAAVRYARSNVTQGALVAVEPSTGAVRALVGGTDYTASQFNRAVQAHRQPGSTFKPFVYLTAFEDGYSPWSTIADEPVSFGRYSPVNYDRRYHGTVTLERAVASSMNIPAVKVANAVGIDRVLRTAHAAGIRSELPANLSVALGSAEVTPLELASAYATFGADGMRAEPRLVMRVEDKNGNVLATFPVERQRVFSEGAVSALHHCLQAVISYGSGGAANIGRPAAGKTGTTSENRDTWFAGYTPDLACVIWLGNDDNSRLASSATGGGLAAPLWGQFMRRALAGVPARALTSLPAPPAAPDGTATDAGRASESAPLEAPADTGSPEGEAVMPMPEVVATEEPAVVRPAAPATAATPAPPAQPPNLLEASPGAVVPVAPIP